MLATAACSGADGHDGSPPGVPPVPVARPPVIRPVPPSPYIAPGAPLPPSASSAVPDASERRLLDERRLLEGRIQSLDRTLAPYDRERLRSRTPDPARGGVPAPVQDPVAERQELERRNLQARDRLIEDRLRQQRYNTSPRDAPLGYR